MQHKQSQFELFPGAVEAPAEQNNPRSSFSSLTLSVEHLIVFSVILIVSMVIAFSFGVERGKKIVQKVTPDRLRVASQNPQRSPQVPAVVSPQPPAHHPVVSTSEGLNKEGDPQPGHGAAPVENLKPSVIRTVVPVENLPPPQPEKTVDKGYTVQVASFKNQEYAEKEAAALKQSGYASFVMTKGSHVIVCTGNFSKKKEAEALVKKLKKRYKDCVVRSL